MDPKDISSVGTVSRKWFFFLGVLILLLGGLGAWYSAQIADRNLRQDLLQESQILSRDLNLDHLQSLQGDENDLSSPKYQRMKEQLSLLRKAIPHCRFLYLMGKNAEGKVFVYLDSEPMASKDYSPPGQIYSEVSAEFSNVFESKNPIVEGPIPDRWGLWVSAVTPVVDPASGKVVAVLGMDLDARTWKGYLVKASLPVVLLSLGFLGVLGVGASLLSRRSRLQSSAPPDSWMVWIEPGMVLVSGLILTLFLAWMAHQGELRQHSQAFVSLANSRISGVAESLRNLRTVGLEGVVSYCTGEDEITQKGFQQYAAYLTRDPTIQTWAWMPKVPDAMRTPFEQKARQSGWTDYRIWEMDPSGQRVPVAQRESYYPVLFVAPLDGNEAAVGLDLAAENLRRVALEEALHTGLASASAPVTFVKEPNGQKGIIVFRPVYQSTESRQIRGVVAAGLRFGALLKSAEFDDYISLQLSVLQEEQTVLSMTSFPTAALKGQPPTVHRPILAFGRVFIVRATASAKYLDQYVSQWGGRTLVFGLLLSGALAWGVALTLRRGLQLERLVEGKTSELKDKNRRLDEIAALMRSLLDSIPDMIFFKDTEGVYLGCNPVFLEFAGRSREEVVGKTDYDLFCKEVADEFRETDRVMLQLKRPRHNEEWITYPDGRRRLLDTVKTPYWGPEGSLVGVVGISRDITERKRTEHQLRESETNFRTLFETITDLITVSDAAGRILFANSSASNLLGYEAAELSGMTLYDLHSIEQRAEAEQILQAILKGESNRCLLPLKHKGGGMIPVETRVWFGQWNGQECFFAWSKDLRAQQEAQQHFEALFRHNPSPMALSTFPGRIITDVNRAFLEQLGFTRQEVLGKTSAQLQLFVDPQQQAIIGQKLLSEGRISSQELQIHAKDGTLLEGLFSGEIIQSQGQEFLLTLMVDITARKRAERLLAENEAFQRLLLENIDAGLVIIDAQTHQIEQVNSKAASLLGARADQIIGEVCHSFLCPSEKNRCPVSDFGEQLNNSERILLRSDGSRIPIVKSARKIWVKGSEKILETFVDISSIKQMERQLKESEEKYRVLFEAESDGILVVEKDTGLILDCNNAAVRMYGFARQELLRRPFRDLSSEDEPAIHRKKDGVVFPVEITQAETRIGQSEVTVVAIRDVTERKEMEQKLLRAQRMESIGALAGGVAHDLNNILAPILMSASMLRDEAVEAEFREQMISGIETAAKRGANIVSQVLTFARGIHGIRTAFAPQSLLKEIEMIVGETFPKSIRLNLLCPKDLWSILADFTQLHQVLMNLCVNARDAMPQGGTLALSAENFIADGEFAARFDDFKSGRYVRFRVIDTGTGIAPEDLQKIFEPFFTTKGPTIGTGLGLSTVLGIVRSHEGLVSVHSDWGRGTTFEVLIPACEQTVPANPSPEPAGSVHGNGEMILLVDDEPEILRLLSTILERRGYQVVSARDGEEALLYYARHEQQIRLVITDLMMPHMNGATFSSVLRKTNPGLPIIAASGYGTDAMQQEMAELKIQAFLHKPFDADLLLRTIRDVIHRP